jgi:hypothetical protein
MSLVQVTEDAWLRADTVVSVEIEIDANSYFLAVYYKFCDDVERIECGKHEALKAAREAAGKIVQTVNDALREIA